jgi:class 3 adenylate cyclase
MEIVQWHTSVPDHSSEEEIWPGTGEPQWYENVSVLFTDFVGFSNAVATVPAKKLVYELNEIFAEFDRITSANGLEKIKTIGDAYMAVAGLNNHLSNHAVDTVRAASQMLEYLYGKNQSSALKWEMRAGIHSGPVVGGVIGTEKLSFDLWGDTVNIASRMEAASLANRINISAYTYELVMNLIPCEYRGKIDTKDKGKLDMYFIL